MHSLGKDIPDSAETELRITIGFFIWVSLGISIKTGSGDKAVFN